MANWAQPEDKLWPELLDALEDRRPRHDEWAKSGSFVAAAERGGSGNWTWLRNAVKAIRGDREAIANVSYYADRENDYNLNEPYVDDAHELYIFGGKVALRDALLFGPAAVRSESLGERLTREIRQKFAVELLVSTLPATLERSFCLPPGARSSAPKTQRWSREYVLLRALGLSHDAVRSRATDGRGIAKRMDRIYDHKEVSLTSVVDRLVPSFRSDFEPVFRAFSNDGFRGLVPFLVVGSRVGFSFYVSASGFAAAMESNCNGNNGPRWLSIGDRSPNRPLQFPPEAVRRQQTETGSAGIDLASKTVWARTESSGSYSGPLPAGERVLYVRSSPSGWEEIGAAEPEPGGGGTPPPVPPPKPRKERWWESL